MIAMTAVWVSVSILVTFLTVRLAWKLKFLSYPNPIVASHTKPVAYLGGGAILATMFLSRLITNTFFSDTFSFEQASLKICTACFVLFMIGVVDDYLKLNPGRKLTLQIMAAIILIGLGYTINLFEAPLLNIGLSGFILLFMLNAFNLIDVCDGLLTLVFLPCLIFFYVTLQDNFTLLIASTLLGFLLFNKPDAKIYLGDAGSHLLGGIGFIYVSKFINPTSLSTIMQDSMILIMVFSVILFEFSLLLYRRTRKGISIFRGSPDHFSILLTKRGWQKKRIILTAFCLSALTVLIAFLSHSTQVETTLFNLLGLTAVSLFIATHLNQLDREQV